MNAVSWLNKIESPEDLRGLRLEALKDLAKEIRHVIAQACSMNGGHFAPSLGVVELTIALHYVMNAPEDKIVWDVGHQAYPHKLLTGRASRFHTLRQMNGISGFPKREESPYDAFGAGHASTSISAALGMAMARDQRGEHYRVIAVTGDGAMTGGLCYEGLNNLGYLGTDMLIILNDNEMSISPNIGAMSRYFNQLITTSLYNRSREAAHELIKKVGPVGKKVLDLGHRIEGSIKNLIVPDTIFEKMGIRYLGPIDGHNLSELIETLQNVRELKGPILLHVKTMKGKGYKYSELDPERWHSGSDFEIDTGVRMANDDAPAPDPAIPTYTEIFSRTLIELARADNRIVAITAAMPTGTGLSRFAKAFPTRCVDVGIAESHAVCCAAGMACQGLRPVVTIYSSFLQRAFDQIIHDVALQKLPVTFAIDRAGLVGEDGPTHHGVFDLSYLRMIPDMVVMAPRDEQQLRAMMLTASTYDGGPIAYRYPRGEAMGVLLDNPIVPVEIGRGEILLESGGGNGPRVAILTLGPPAAAALSAARTLANENFGVSVTDMRFLKPLDLALLEKVTAEADLVVTVEENVIAGGFGSAVGEALSALGITKHIIMLGVPDRWVEQGPVSTLLALCGIDAEGIARSVRAAVEEQSPFSNIEVVGK